ncbi:MAG TPA: tetratricopeptide repeat protein [Rhodanobacter sp.]|nr:tetratricopeptide repeat protein [Rhodanobacter sp.]
MNDESNVPETDGLSGDVSLRASEFAKSGLALAAQGRLREAEDQLQHARRLLPGDPAITFDLARVILSSGRAADALALVEQTLAIVSNAASLLLLRAQILLSMEQPTLAASAFRQAVSADPANGPAELGLAIALGQSGQPLGATDAVRQAIRKGADSAGARYVLGRSLLASSRFEEAEHEFKHALQMRPDDVQAHAALAELLWMRTGNVELASSELDMALARNPALSALRVTKAKLLVSAGDSTSAMAELERGLSRAARDVNLHLAAAQVALGFDPAQALAHAEQAYQAARADAAVVAIYGDALFCAGRVVDAGQIAMHGLRIKPGDNHSIALLHSVWRALDDPRRMEFSDYTSLVRACQIDSPPGWPDLRDYLRDLAGSVHRLHQLDTHPVEQTLRLGTQVEIPCGGGPSEDPAIAAFSQAIDGPIRRYMALLGPGGDVVRRRNTMRYRLNGMWSVRLKPYGHHVNHFHGKGWLSSACYIELPGTLGSHDGEGWLKFGEPSFRSSLKLEPEYFIKPEPGLLALFPSWMWHGTVPFRGLPTDRRLTMAFDVVPV